MAHILSVKGVKPVFGKECWMAENATIAGDVITGDECTFWFNAVVRGDVNAIRMGNRVNVQDGAVIHCTYQKSQTIIGDFVSIAHNAIVHGCTIHDRVLIGMGAIVMDGAVIGSDSIIAAGAIVTQNMVIPPRSIYAGNPAKFLKEITPELEAVFMRTANNYVMYASMYD
jgi:gamma-carbonic anhydrase